jgi:hypothetical protein
MTTVQAQIELDHLKHQQNADLGSYFGADYPTSDQVTDMQHHLHEVEIAQVVPLLVQLGILIWATTSEKQLASQERQRREQLRTKIETAAREISDQILGDGWNSSIDMFREQLRAQLPPDGLLASMQDHLNQLADASRALSDLLKKT